MKLLWPLILALFNLNIAYGSFLPDSFSADFEQEYMSTLRAKPKKGNGAIEYKFPGQIRFETNTPSTVIYVSNGKTSWYYRAPFIEGEEGEVTVSNVNESTTLYTRFFDILKNGLKTNANYQAVENGDKQVILKFTEKASKEFGIRESLLSFEQKDRKFGNLISIELTFNDGKKSTLNFKNLKTNLTFKADRFNFSPPANTKVVN